MEAAMGVMTAHEFYLNKNILARVEAGETIEITNHGRPVARIGPPTIVPEPARPERGTPEWQEAYDRMVATMDQGFPLGVGRLTYEDKHE